MWSSSSVVSSGGGISSESSIHSIAQYIEDYMDLVENVPNYIARQITQLHEHNHRYHQLLAQLESTLDIACGKTAASEPKKRNAMIKIQRLLIEIQEIADEKLILIQLILDQLDSKARQLDYDYRAVTMTSGGSGGHTVNSRGFMHLFSGNTNSVATNQLPLQKSDSSHSNVIGNSSAHHVTANTNDHHGTNNKDSTVSGTSGGGSLGNGNNTIASVSSSSISHNSGSGSGKRASTRRQVSRGNDNGDGKKSVKRRVKGPSRELKKSKNNSGVMVSSPTPLYEGAPIDPDEPTYCLCDQVSYGEMICCDNSACTIEWFHFSCVSLNTKPKGKWYCPNCRGERSNIPKK